MSSFLWLKNKTEKIIVILFWKRLFISGWVNRIHFLILLSNYDSRPCWNLFWDDASDIFTKSQFSSFWTCVVVILKNLASIHIRYTLERGVGVIWSRSYMVILNIYLVLNIYLSYIFKIKQIPTHLLLRPIK